MIEKLIQLGLTEKEAEVYLSLLKGGEATADQLAKSAKLNRSTTYVQIKELSEYGLVSTFKRGKKTFYSAESPNNLDRLIEHKSSLIELQRSEVKLLIPELLKFFGSSMDRPTVRVFEGKEGLVSMRNEILESGIKNLQIAFSIDSMSKIFTVSEMMAFSNKRASKKIFSKAIYTKTDGEDIVRVPPQELRRVDIKKYPFGSDIYIYGDTVSFASTQGQVVGITIKNADIAKTMKALFDIAWEHSDTSQ
jgi:sugar-specific transcriptional regulator TrmB